ncbi:hypothetical protein CMT52_19100 [Elizabethkingia anophelis]|nr:hypothetical protein [Elizabethkingia anophelis]MDV4026440.1 hypothetical protein [Elizabethkingia anophelis]
MFKLFFITFIGFILYSCSAQASQQKSDINRNIDVLNSKQNEIIKPIDIRNYRQNDPNKKYPY